MAKKKKTKKVIDNKYATEPIDGKPLVNIAGQKLLKTGLYDTGARKKHIDWEQAELLCSMDCTQEEMAAVLKISVDTLVRRMREDLGLTYTEFESTNKAIGNVSIKRTIYNLAVHDKDRVMLKLLAINRLKYVERNNSEVIERVVYVNEATALSDEELEKEIDELEAHEDDYGIKDEDEK